MCCHCLSLCGSSMIDRWTVKGVLKVDVSLCPFVKFAGISFLTKSVEE